MSTPRTPDQTALAESIRSALQNDGAAIGPLLAPLHPADIAGALQDLHEEEFARVLDLLEPELRAEIVSHFAQLDEERIEDYLDAQSPQEIAEIVDELSPDDAVDLLEVADDQKAEAVLGQLDSDEAKEIRELRRFAPDSAGGIMTPDFIQVRPADTPSSIIEQVKKEHDEIESLQRVFVCREDGRLLGGIDISDLLVARPTDTAKDLMDRAVVSVGTDTDQEVCAKLMTKYDIPVLPVVGSNNVLEGIITADDILDVQADEAEEDMFRLVGVGDNKPLEHGPVIRAFKRLPWLAATLLGMGLLGPLLLHRWFSATLDQIVVLAFFIPAVMGLSGSAATQSATITVRGLATDEIAFRDFFWMLRREMTVAAIIAAVCALTMMLFAYAVTELGFNATGSSTPLGITGTIGLSMVAGILVGALLGVTIPMLCHRAGVDPAVASGPFITTAIDITAQIIYLGLATWLLLA